MLTKWKCRQCGRWFRPTPRAGDRQRSCSDPECQSKRHAGACERWRAANPDYDGDRELRARVVAEVPPEQAQADPLRQIQWNAARDAVGLQMTVNMRETAQVVVNWARDAVEAHSSVIPMGCVMSSGPLARDALRAGAPPL